MMARPRTPIGTWGVITVVPQVTDGTRWITAPIGTRPGRYRARTKVRDTDGKLREVERYASTRARAEQRLKSALAERSAPRATDELSRETSLGSAGEVWLRRISRPESGLSEATVEQYEAAWKRTVASAPIASMSLSEVNRVPRVRTFLEDVADSRGSGSAKTTRTVLSLVIGSAVDEGLFEVNAVRQVKTPKRATPTPPATSKRAERLRTQHAGEPVARDTSRAMTKAERADFLAFVRADARAHELDVADLAMFFAGTGVRISEALALEWADVRVSTSARREIEIRGTKTDASHRILTPPPWLARELQRRRREATNTAGLVFPAPLTDRKRDRRNTARALRDLLDRAGFPWATPHTFRRTVASILDGAGMPIALVADVLGHADPSMTARVYLGRRGDTSRAASIL